MRNVQLLSVFIILGLMACQKESLEDNLNNFSNETPISLRSSVVAAYDSLPIEKQANQSPSIETLNKVVSKFIQNLSAIQKDSIEQVYGNLRVNAARVAAQQTDFHLISIPFEKNRKVTGILYYYVHGGHDHFILYNYIHLQQLIHTPQDKLTDLDEMAVMALHDMYYYQWYRLHKYSPEVEDFLEKYNEDNFQNETEVKPRNIEITIPWITFGDPNYPNIAVINSSEKTFTFPCPGEDGDGGAGIGSDDFFHMSNSDHSGSILPSDHTGPSQGSGVPILPHTNSPSLKLGLDDLDDDCRDFQIGQEVFNTLADLAGMHDPCTNRDATQIVKDIFEDLCFEVNPMGNGINITSSGTTEPGDDPQIDLSKHVITKTDFKNALDGVEHLMASLSACPQYACVFQNMLQGTLNSNFMCELIDIFDDKDKEGPRLTIVTASFSSSSNINSNANAFATPRFDINGSYLGQVITINTDKCNNSNPGQSPLEVFNTLQHEFIHAKFNQILIDIGWNGDSNTRDVTWLNYVKNTYNVTDPTPNQHYRMLELHLDDMLNSLIELNNGHGTKSDFIGLVLNGIDQPTLLHWAGITLQDVTNKYNHYLNFINTPGNSFFMQNYTPC